MFKKVILGLIIVLVIIFLYRENNSIVITQFSFKYSKLPEEFSGYKILHISDLHNKNFGKNQEKIMKYVNDINPDIVVITGDIIDRRRYNEEPSLNLVKQLADVCSVYYVTGNHEAWSGKFDDLKEKLIKSNAKVLRNKKVELIKGNSKINILGIDDYAFFDSGFEYDQELRKLTDDINEGEITILLSHRPDKIDYYSKYPIDIAFTGHAHGGQIRLPYIGGLIAPDQGILPKYTSGVYEKNGLKMIVSRGLGNSIFPQRLFNRPELIVVTLEK